jgi:sulfur relay (sulfurtransferase) complex TusBCD TusD component (DsrE family)
MGQVNQSRLSIPMQSGRKAVMFFLKDQVTLARHKQTARFSLRQLFELLIQHKIEITVFFQVLNLW